jgi:hypothetical protein
MGGHSRGREAAFVVAAAPEVQEKGYVSRAQIQVERPVIPKKSGVRQSHPSNAKGDQLLHDLPGGVSGYGAWQVRRAIGVCLEMQFGSIPVEAHYSDFAVKQIGGVETEHYGAGRKKRRCLGRFASVDHNAVENRLKDYRVKAELLHFDSSTGHVLEGYDEAVFQGAAEPRGAHDSNRRHGQRHQRPDNSKRNPKMLRHSGCPPVIPAKTALGLCPLPRTKAGNWFFALSLGERVSRYRRFHQPERDGSLAHLGVISPILTSKAFPDFAHQFLFIFQHPIRNSQQADPEPLK